MADDERFDIEHFPTSESAKRMLSYVTADFYEKSYVGKWIYQVMGLEYDKAREIVEELPLQLFPETATWGLMYHEIKWGLPIRENLSYEERRRRIYEKRDYRAPMTPYRMETYLKNATGFDVFVADVNEPGQYGFVADHPNRFKAYFMGEGTLDSKAVHKLLDKLKQSHTVYTVNQRTEIIVDERDLESVILKNINFKMAIPYWGGLLLDGTWYLDGSHDLSAHRRYGLRIGFLIRLAGVTTKQDAELKNIRFLMKNQIVESLNARANYSFGVSFWRAYCLDGSWILDGSKLLDSIRKKDRLSIQFKTASDSSEIEDVSGMTITTKTRDYWYLDGAFSLDGTKKINAIYRKEEVE